MVIHHKTCDYCKLMIQRWISLDFWCLHHRNLSPKSMNRYFVNAGSFFAKFGPASNFLVCGKLVPIQFPSWNCTDCLCQDFYCRYNVASAAKRDDKWFVVFAGGADRDHAFRALNRTKYAGSYNSILFYLIIRFCLAPPKHYLIIDQCYSQVIKYF
jgi:hypothetical protein